MRTLTFLAFAALSTSALAADTPPTVTPQDSAAVLGVMVQECQGASFQARVAATAEVRALHDEIARLKAENATLNEKTAGSVPAPDSSSRAFSTRQPH